MRAKDEHDMARGQQKTTAALGYEAQIWTTAGWGSTASIVFPSEILITSRICTPLLPRSRVPCVRHPQHDRFKPTPTRPGRIPIA